MARTPDIPGLKLDRTEVSYDVHYNGDYLGWVSWSHQKPNEWVANHLGSFPGKKTFKGQTARAKGAAWLIEQEAVVEAEEKAKAIAKASATATSTACSTTGSCQTRTRRSTRSRV